MLIILEDLMWKLKVAENLADVPRPCEYFDLIGGTSTGGWVLPPINEIYCALSYGQIDRTDAGPPSDDG
jgi:hypothetical protein